MGFECGMVDDAQNSAFADEYTVTFERVYEIKH